MAIVHVRVDDRVIHGQITTGWIRKKPADGFLVISDKVAQDSMRCKVLKAAAGNIKLGIYTVDQGVEALKKALASPKRFFIISDSISTFQQLTERGSDYGGTLNIGNLNGTREGTKGVGNALMLNDQDLHDLDYLQDHGVTLEFQLLANDSIKSWASVRDKYLSL